MLTLAVNICNYGTGFGSQEIDMVTKQMGEIEVENEQKLKIYDKCSQKAISLMEKYVRNALCRSLLKKTLNIYCESITVNINELKKLEKVESNEPAAADNENSLEYKWRQSLYHIVISIVRILRQDFENQVNPVEIDLVIYFYELLKVKI